MGEERERKKKKKSISLPLCEMRGCKRRGTIKKRWRRWW